MRRGRPGVILIIILAIALIGGIFWLAKALIFDNNSGAKNSVEQLNDGEKLLKERGENLGLRLSVRGPIVAPENHYSLALTVKQDSRNLTIWRGYNGEIFKKIERKNSAKSFADFLAAAERAGIATEKNSGQNEQNLAGICASGQLIRFEILEKNAAKFSLWTTSCNGISGNFGGAHNNLIELFLKQIPDAKKEINLAKNRLSK